MTLPKRVYLAGPEVFFPEAQHQAIVAAKKRILAEYGFEGVDPLDTALQFAEGVQKRDCGLEIYRANRELMDGCDALIGNLTPFRGLSADPGTVFEVGYMTGQGKVAFGFTMDQRHYHHRAGDRARDDQGHAIEDFDLTDNLMIEGGIEASGGRIFRADSAATPEWFGEQLFEQCVRALADRL